MSNETKLRIHKIYGVFLTALILLAGLCLMAACCHLYCAGAAQGTEPFSRPLVEAAFSPIALPVYLCLAAVIGSILLHIALPVDVKPKPEPSRHLLLRHLAGKTDLSACDASLAGLILGLRRRRRLWDLISIGVSVLSAVILLLYALDGRHWEDVNDSVVKAMWVFLPCTALPMVVWTANLHQHRNNMDAEIALLRQAATQAKTQDTGSAAPQGRSMCVIRWTLAVAAIAAIVFGVWGDGISSVIAKAVAICTECIGLG